MQITRGTRISARRLQLFPILACLCMAAALMAALPSQAQAKDYTMPHVNITAEVTDSGDVHIVEQRQFDFDGSFTTVWWTFSGLPSNASLEVNSVTLQEGSSGSVADAAPRTVSGVPFQTSWRTAGGPGTEAYSWDGGRDTLYVFFDITDGSLVATIDYTVVNGISAYKDVGELYWQYISAEWAVSSQDVTATVTLPVPAGQSVVAGDTVRAWGHGPLDGTVAFNDDGTITYTVPEVRPRQYAEARVVFPVSWLANLSDSSKALHENENHLDTVLAEEQQWADSANAQRIQSLLFVAFWIVISIALVIWAVIMFFRWGRELKPRFTDEYWRDVPDKDLSPAVIGRLMDWGHEDSRHFTATLMGLSNKGVVRIDKGSYQNKRGKTVEDYYLTLLPDVLERTEVDELERKAIDFVFGDIAKGEDSLWFRTIEIYGEDHPRNFANKMEGWQGKLTSEVNKAQLFEAKGDSLQGAMRIIAGAYFILAIIVVFFFENFLPLIPILPTCIVLAVIAQFMQRRTQRGADVAARADALKRWLKDFTRLDERPPTDVRVWGQFMVYAYIFGIADQVMKDLRMNVPTFRDMDDAAFYSAMPYYYWYSPGMGHRSVNPANLFDATMANTLDTANAAISAASGSSSSGGGFGGGFSVGGGGGFGGGGGAR